MASGLPLLLVTSRQKGGRKCLPGRKRKEDLWKRVVDGSLVYMVFKEKGGVFCDNKKAEEASIIQKTHRGNFGVGRKVTSTGDRLQWGEYCC